MNESIREATLLKGITSQILESLNGYELFIEEEAIIEMLENLISKIMVDSHAERSKVINDLDRISNTTAQVISDKILTSLAEERPGTDPFSHEPNILTPLTFILTLIYSLSVAAKMATENNEPEYAGLLLEAIGSLAHFTTTEVNGSKLLSKEVDISEIGQDGNKIIPGPSILIPQPVLAYISRLMINIIGRLNSRWEQDETSLLESITTLQRQIDLLVILRKRYGASGNPTEIS